MFDPTTLDAQGAESYRKRHYVGGRCIALAWDGPWTAFDGDHPGVQDEDRETYAKDAVADILTALFGPAGVYRYTGPEDKSLPTHEPRLIAQEEARALVQEALDSWYGDAEDYTVAS